MAYRRIAFIRGRGRPRKGSEIQGGINFLIKAYVGGFIGLFIMDAMLKALIPIINTSCFWGNNTAPYNLSGSGGGLCAGYGAATNIGSYLGYATPIIGVLVIFLPLYIFVKRYMQM